MENTSIIWSWGLKRGSAIQVGLKQVSKRQADDALDAEIKERREEERRREH